MWKFVTLLSLSISLPFVYATPRRGGGGGGGDIGSGSSDDSSDSSDSSSTESHTQYIAPEWPYRWTGSYYNGTISVAASITTWPRCAEHSRAALGTTFDGILLLGPDPDGYESSANIHPQFVLMGWNQNQEPVSNWTDMDRYYGWNRGDSLYYSPDVRMVLSMYTDVFRPEYPEITKLGVWSTDAQAAGKGSGRGYEMNGTYYGSEIYEIHATDNENWLNITAPGCMGTATDYFKMLVSTASPDSSHLPQNTTVRGTFDDQRASFTWTGTYWGGFQSSVEYDYLTTDRYPAGLFNVTFTGDLDRRQSDRLSPMATPVPYAGAAGSGAPEWTKVRDRDGNVPQESIFYSSAKKVKGEAVWVGAGALLAGFALVIS